MQNLIQIRYQGSAASTFVVNECDTHDKRHATYKKFYPMSPCPKT